MCSRGIWTKQDLSYISLCSLRILYNSKFILMATSLRKNAVVVTRVRCIFSVDMCKNIQYLVLPTAWVFSFLRGWSGGAKVSCILRHRGVQLILAYNWARPVTLVTGKGRGGMFYFFCFFTFILVRLSYLSLSFISSTISSISFLPFSGRRHKMTHKGWRVVKPQHNQSI